MPYQFVSADLHLGHANICLYANRPYVMTEDLKDGWWVSQEAAVQCAERMNKSLISYWNERVKPGDTVYHLGDFINIGKARGVKGLRNNWQHYEEQLNGKVVHILGNHDRNNKLRHGLESAIINVGGFRFLLKHHPTLEGEKGFNAILCGHVHDKWKHKWEKGVLFINVGVDVRNLRPVRMDEVIGIYRKLTKEREELCLTGIA